MKAMRAESIDPACQTCYLVGSYRNRTGLARTRPPEREGGISMRKGSLAASLLLLVLSSITFAAAPESIWIAPLADGRTIGAAWKAGVDPLDRFPEALILADAGDAKRLARAGFKPEGPVPLPTGGAVSLVRSRSHGGSARDELRRIADEPGVTVLWSDGRCAVVHTAGPLHEAGVAGHVESKPLRMKPIRRPVSGRFRDAGKSAVTEFPPHAAVMAAQVDSAAYMEWIGNLAGANEVMISGHPFTFTTRYTHNAQCDTAERYVYECFLAMGIDSVEFDPYSFQGTDARNVIATLVGEETPERIYILGGHLDATSEQPNTLAPGANDNASGAAAVLAAAEILKSYTFRSTIKLIAFTGEEQGLYGSTHYAQQAAAAGDSILGVVTCDMVAWYDGQYKLIIEGETPWDWLMQIMKDACDQYTGLATQLDYYSWGSDHVPFQNEGFPAFLAIEKEWSSYPCYHSTCDTTGLQRGDFGADVTRACLATIAYMAEPLTSLTSVAGEGDAPATTTPTLARNRPNPFNPSTTIDFFLPGGADTELAVFDLSGRRVRTLLGEPLAGGDHRVSWDGRNDDGRPVRSGVYFYRLRAGGETITRKMTLLR